MLGLPTTAVNTVWYCFLEKIALPFKNRELRMKKSTAPKSRTAAFKPCAACKSPAKCKAAGKCLAKGMKYGGKVVKKGCK
jgi:hypothetical protein